MTTEDEKVIEELDEAEDQDAEQEEAPEEEASEDQSGGNQDEIQDSDETGETIILIGDEEPSEQESETAPQWVRDLRKQNKEQAKRIKELEAKTAKPEEELGPRPKLDDPDIDYDEDKLYEAMDTWNKKKARIDDKKRQAEDRQRQDEARYSEKLTGYHERKTSLGVQNFESLEERVVEGLSDLQQSMIISATQKPEAVIAALGQHPRRLNELAKVEDPVEFIAEIVRLEMNVKTSVRKKPAPERKMSAPTNGIRGASDRKLEELEKEAERTGDRTKVLDYKRGLRRAAMN